MEGKREKNECGLEKEGSIIYLPQQTHPVMLGLWPFACYEESYANSTWLKIRIIDQITREQLWDLTYLRNPLCNSNPRHVQPPNENLQD